MQLAREFLGGADRDSSTRPAKRPRPEPSAAEATTAEIGLELHFDGHPINALSINALPFTTLPLATHSLTHSLRSHLLRFHSLTAHSLTVLSLTRSLTAL